MSLSRVYLTHVSVPSDTEAHCVCKAREKGLEMALSHSTTKRSQRKGWLWLRPATSQGPHRSSPVSPPTPDAGLPSLRDLHFLQATKEKWTQPDSMIGSPRCKLILRARISWTLNHVPATPPRAFMLTISFHPRNNSLPSSPTRGHFKT